MTLRGPPRRPMPHPQKSGAYPLCSMIRAATTGAPLRVWSEIRFRNHLRQRNDRHHRRRRRLVAERPGERRRREVEDAAVGSDHEVAVAVADPRITPGYTLRRTVPLISPTALGPPAQSAPAIFVHYEATCPHIGRGVEGAAASGTRRRSCPGRRRAEGLSGAGPRPVESDSSRDFRASVCSADGEAAGRGLVPTSASRRAMAAPCRRHRAKSQSRVGGPAGRHALGGRGVHPMPDGSRMDRHNMVGPRSPAWRSSV